MHEEADSVFLGIKEKCVLVCGNKAFEEEVVMQRVCTISRHQSLDRTVSQNLLFVLSH